MTLSFTTNSNVAGFVQAVFNLKTALKSAGWTVPKSSDGTTYNNSGDQITSFSSGAGGLNNPSAWFVISFPGSNRSFCFQRGTSNNNSWRIKCADTNAFTSGSPSATRTPTASAGDITILGSGTDSSPIFSQWTSATDGSVYVNMAVDGASPYGFYMFLTNVGGHTVRSDGLIVVDPVNGAASGDASAYVILISGNGSSGFDGSGMVAEGNTVLWTFSGQNPTGCYYSVHTGSATTPSTTVIPGGLAKNPFTGKDDLIPVPVMRRSGLSSPLYKGMTSLMRWQGVGRAALTTFTNTRRKDYISVHTTLALPWDGSIPQA